MDSPNAKPRKTTDADKLDRYFRNLTRIATRKVFDAYVPADSVILDLDEMEQARAEGFRYSSPR